MARAAANNQKGQKAAGRKARGPESIRHSQQGQTRASQNGVQADHKQVVAVYQQLELKPSLDTVAAAIRETEIAVAAGRQSRVEGAHTAAAAELPIRRVAAEAAMVTQN